MAKKSYKLRWSDAAQHDLARVIEYIQYDRPQTAKKILKSIRSRAASLKSYPRRGRTVPELAHLPNMPFRELICRPWRLIYQIKSNEVHILAFLDSRRDLEEILYERIVGMS